MSAADLNPSERKRLALYDLCVTNAGLHGLGDLFICPICRNKFTRDDCLGENCKLTLAHIYPKATGGKPTTLACRECNNRLGKRYDSEIVREHQIAGLENKDPNVSVRTEFTMAGEKFRANLSRDNEGMKVHIVAGANDPVVIARLQEKLKQLPNDSPYTFTHRAVNQDLWLTAMVYSAHLLLFREFGYEYLESELGKWVLQLALDAENKGQAIPLRTYGLTTADGFTPDIHYKIILLHTPYEQRSIWAVLPSPIKTEMARAVALPGALDPESLAAFNNLTNNFSQSNARFSDTSAGSTSTAERLINEQFKFFMRALWKAIYTKVIPK
jgi:HNH endonuclease